MIALSLELRHGHQYLLPLRDFLLLRLTTALAWRIAEPASAPRLSAEARTCAHCRRSFGVNALRVCLDAGTPPSYWFNCGNCDKID